jgi:hypothetical protein
VRVAHVPPFTKSTSHAWPGGKRGVAEFVRLPSVPAIRVVGLNRRPSSWTSLATQHQQHIPNHTHAHSSLWAGKDDALLVAQAIDRIEVGCEVCGIVAEENADADGDGETDGDPEIGERGRDRRNESANQG